jgi:hypothetical protein
MAERLRPPIVLFRGVDGVHIALRPQDYPNAQDCDDGCQHESAVALKFEAFRHKSEDVLVGPAIPVAVPVPLADDRDEAHR